MPRCLIRVSLNWNRGAELKGCRRTLLRRFDKLYKEGISSFTDSHQLDLLCVNHSSPQQSMLTLFNVSPQMASGFPFALLLCLSIGLLAPSCCGQTCCPGSCPPGWTQFGSRCFSFNFQGKSWTDAETFCKAAGGNLASVHSEEEHVFLRTFINQVSGEHKVTWMGGFDSVQEGVWMWSDGSIFDYKHWHVGQPDNAGGNENCLEMNRQDNWNDRPCTDIRPFLCSKKL
ncbi:galactose-specific lectin nattectin-like isoform X2 [Sander lucioperca]|uniref:galactose-specific lectin nattectin-like isoform X2 n=1 Tax=Sander lucioperca TaxID=283035 RepID=UPI00125D90C5|nr:galactose-specific lectin nattectin-like isoform X2 [Sander lucioperca]